MVRISLLEHSLKKKIGETEKFLEFEVTLSPGNSPDFTKPKSGRTQPSRNRQLKFSTVTSVQNYWFGILKGSKDLSLPYSCTVEIFLVFQFQEAI